MSSLGGDTQRRTFGGLRRNGTDSHNDDIANATKRFVAFGDGEATKAVMQWRHGISLKLNLKVATYEPSSQHMPS